MTTAKQTKPHVPLKDYYTVEDVSVLLGIGENMVRELAGRDKDPLPFRRLNGKVRGMFIGRSDLARWVQANSFLVALDGKKRSWHDEH
jgi:predicted transcriptional regulator of viral defense system